MSRTTLLFFSLLTLIFGTVTLGTAGQRYDFPKQGCSVYPPMREGEVTCKYLGSPDGGPVYSLHYGRTGQPLLEFIRSAEVIQGDLPYQIAVNSYEGSNYIDCYVFWDAKNPANKLSLASTWKEVLHDLPEEKQAAITESDSMYYLCTAWSNNTLNIEAGWRRFGYPRLEATAKFSSSGLSDITYKSVP